MRADLKLLWGLVVLAAAGCGDGLGSPYPSTNWGPASNSLFTPAAADGSGVAGDWFPCKDTACRTLDDDGFRFTVDNRWNALEAPGSSLDQNEQYCLEQSKNQSGSYTLSGQILTLQSAGSMVVQKLTFELQGVDQALVTISYSGYEASGPMQRINPPRASGPCQDEDPIPVPMP